MAELVTIYAKNKEIGLAAVSETDKAVHEYIFQKRIGTKMKGAFRYILHSVSCAGGFLAGMTLAGRRASSR